jgi:hypothetical protein
MMQFNLYLAEAAASEEKLTHLEHAEDHVIHGGMEGFAHAYHNLEDVKEQINGKKNKTKIATKYDGAPSIVFGHHPETGAFFVSTKSAFNKDPKLNYTPEDIEKNHGHAPGLVQKLKHALEHLPKVTPKTGVYQGDVMHSGIQSKTNPHGDVVNEGGKYHFKPNTLTYSTPHSSAEGKKLAGSKFGVAVHTAYEGNTLEGMKAQYGADLAHFPKHPDVHVVSTVDDVHKADLNTNQSHTYEHHMAEAKKVFLATDKKHYDTALKGKTIGTKADGTPKYEHEHHVDHLKTYINKTVRDGTKPSVEGYTEHLKEKHLKEIAKVKTAKAVDSKVERMNTDMAHVDKHSDKFQNILDMHHHLQAAKDQLVHSLSAKPKFEHSIPEPGSTKITGGKPAKPEGFVVIRNNRPTKFVDRAEFSRANFAARPR